MTVSVTGIDHVGITVSSLQDSIAWFSAVFGATPGAILEAEGPVLARTVRVPGAHFRYVFLSIAQSSIELIEYVNPVSSRVERSNSDLAASHICIAVGDVEAAVHESVRNGATLNGPVVRLPDGSALAYVATPDGVQIELSQPAPRR